MLQLPNRNVELACPVIPRSAATRNLLSLAVTLCPVRRALSPSGYTRVKRNPSHRNHHEAKHAAFRAHRSSAEPRRPAQRRTQQMTAEKPCRCRARNRKMSRPNPRRREIRPRTTRFPVRRNVRQKKNPMNAAASSPATARRHFADESSQTRMTKPTAAGQKPIPRARVNCEYPRRRNSSNNPTSRNITAQKAANRASRAPCSTMCPNENACSP